MTLDEIVNKTREAIQKISDTNSPIWHTTEWNICHHIATNLKDSFTDFDIDVELEKIDRRRPDIVVHRRGNNENNLVVFQIKKHPSIQEIRDDIKKINETFFQKPYLYKFGIFVSVGQLPKPLPKFDQNKIKIVEVYGWKIV